MFKIKRVVGLKGKAKGIALSPELLDYLEVDKGDVVVLSPDQSKHGKFIAVYKE